MRKGLYFYRVGSIGIFVRKYLIAFTGTTVCFKYILNKKIAEIPFFFVTWHISLSGLFDTKSILIEE